MKHWCMNYICNNGWWNFWLVWRNIYSIVHWQSKETCIWICIFFFSFFEKKTILKNHMKSKWMNEAMSHKEQTFIGFRLVRVRLANAFNAIEGEGVESRVCRKHEPSLLWVSQLSRKDWGYLASCRVLSSMNHSTYVLHRRSQYRSHLHFESVHRSFIWLMNSRLSFWSRTEENQPWEFSAQLYMKIKMGWYKRWASMLAMWFLTLGMTQ